MPALFKRTDTDVTVEEDNGEHNASNIPSSPHTPAPVAESASAQPSPDPNPDVPAATSATSKEPTIHPLLLTPPEGGQPLFGIEQLGIDRRMIVNRKRKLKMYRVWMQAKFRKLP